MEAFESGLARPQGGEYSVRVAVRCRPLLPKELSERCRTCVEVYRLEGQISVGKANFAFDHVFGSEDSQEKVHEEAALPLLEGLAAGQNVTLLAYGQTSSGKTFTLGSFSGADEQKGIIPRFVNALFRDVIYPRHSEADMRIVVSFVELHNEDFNDLLDPKMVDGERTVSIRDDPKEGVVIAGLKEVEVKKPTELLRCLEKGVIFRTTASTAMNEQSSRSHAIFTVSLEQRVRSTGEILQAKVRFADLAGSERAKKTNTVGERFREGVNINQGLLALGNVISALGDPKLHRSHVPYRDSKLTRLLQDSLGGNSRTLMIACVSPADVHFSETLNTLKYANRAKNIKNKVIVNLTKEESPDMALLREQIQQLQVELSKARQDQPGLRAIARRATDGDLEAMCRSCEKYRDANARLRAELCDLTAQAHPESQTSTAAVEDQAGKVDDNDDAEESALDEVFMPLDEALVGSEEARAHAEEDAREEEQYSAAQTEMRNAVYELDEVIREKETLMTRLSKQSKVFRTMQARYECQLQQLRQAVEAASQEKASMVKEMQQLQCVKHTNPNSEHDTAKRKAQLEGRLQEVNRQLTDLRRRQGEAQRLLRLKEQQESQMRRMSDEIEKLQAQKSVMLSRMKFEEQQHRLWRKQWNMRIRELNRRGTELIRENRQQGKLLGRKTREAEKAARKIEELQREQLKCLDASRLRQQVEREATRANKLREVNDRLHKELSDRERQVQQMELALSRKARLAQRVSEKAIEVSDAAGVSPVQELQELEDNIESLDAQIEFVGECIAQSQTDILLLSQVADNPDRNGALDSSVEEETVDILPGAEIVAKLVSLEDARATCLACFQALGEAQGETGRLQARVMEVESELTQRNSQLAEVQARQMLAEARWAEQANELQRQHIDKEVYLLSQVDRNLAEEHGLSAILGDGAVSSSLKFPSESGSESPAQMSVQLLLQCRTEQIELLEQHGEHLQQSLARAEAARDEAEARAARSKQEAREAESRAVELEQRPAQGLVPSGTAPSTVPGSGNSLGQSAQARDAGIDMALLPGTGEDLGCCRELQEALEEDGGSGLCPLEAVVRRAGDLLGGAWRDLGLDQEAQQRRLGSLAQATVKLCSEELRLQEGRRKQLQKSLEGIRQLSAAYCFEVPPEAALCATGGTETCEADSGENADEVPLYKRHAVVHRIAMEQLDLRTAALRTDLADLFGLVQEVESQGDTGSAVRTIPNKFDRFARLELLKGLGAKSLPERGVNAAIADWMPQPMDLIVLGLENDSADGEKRASSLREPTVETFAALDRRQEQVRKHLYEVKKHRRRVDEELTAHFLALGVSPQHQEDFFATRGCGLLALSTSQRELKQLQHSVRLQIAQGRVRMAEQWMELGTPADEQERVLQELRTRAEAGAIEELKALNEEMFQLTRKKESRQEILGKVKVYSALGDQIQDFEREASDSARLRGSSFKLLQEEQQRRRFRTKKARLVEEILGHLGHWEDTHGERFIHNGTAIRDVLQQDLEDTKELGGCSLVSAAQPAPTPQECSPMRPPLSARRATAPSIPSLAAPLFPAANAKGSPSSADGQPLSSRPPAGGSSTPTRIHGGSGATPTAGSTNLPAAAFNNGATATAASPPPGITSLAAARRSADAKRRFNSVPDALNFAPKKRGNTPPTGASTPGGGSARVSDPNGALS